MISKKEFEKLFRELYPDLLKYAYVLTNDMYVAEEIVQEVFMSLWETQNKLEIRTSVKHYLFKAVKYTCINYIQRVKPKQQRTTEVDENAFAYENDASETHSHKKIREIIYSLPDQCRAVFLLSRFTGLTYMEIAEFMDISVKTVETQMSIALKKIREKIKK